MASTDHFGLGPTYPIMRRIIRTSPDAETVGLAGRCNFQTSYYELHAGHNSRHQPLVTVTLSEHSVPKLNVQGNVVSSRSSLSSHLSILAGITGLLPEMSCAPYAMAIMVLAVMSAVMHHCHAHPLASSETNMIKPFAIQVRDDVLRDLQVRLVSSGSIRPIIVQILRECAPFPRNKLCTHLRSVLPLLGSFRT